MKWRASLSTGAGASVFLRWSILRQQISSSRRSQYRRERKEESTWKHHPNLQAFSTCPQRTLLEASTLTKLRWIVNALNGKYFQQHVPMSQADK